VPLNVLCLFETQPLLIIKAERLYKPSLLADLRLEANTSM